MPTPPRCDRRLDACHDYAYGCPGHLGRSRRRPCACRPDPPVVCLAGPGLGALVRAAQASLERRARSGVAPAIDLCIEADGGGGGDRAVPPAFRGRTPMRVSRRRDPRRGRRSSPMTELGALAHQVARMDRNQDSLSLAVLTERPDLPRIRHGDNSGPY